MLILEEDFYQVKLYCIPTFTQKKPVEIQEPSVIWAGSLYDTTEV